ncbi:unnamed protein product [Paramecium octaurelia]|uniref:Ubiquinol-cytochrome C reductase hinge domain-containing protein n=1 Tax=Paramecium octaurelia TaxID=43137 RepID=A0A8S1YFV3_PAROT|nr:unnamed protein product [Paramecium octaurelia]CAD8213316.1 unnamed protein product [Paramecium octaurelia]
MSNQVNFGEGKINENYPSAIKTMLEQGKDPKDLLIQYCRPQCKWYDDKYDRCVKAFLSLKNADPEKNCMYPYRDLVTCVEACVQPKIQHALKGNEHGFIFH